MFSIIQTLFLWDIEPRKWLTWYLEECARLRGRPPEEIAPFLPWNLSPEEREKLSGKVQTADTS